MFSPKCAQAITVINLKGAPGSEDRSSFTMLYAYASQRPVFQGHLV
ncbi:hypothetical protein [Gimesia aquarii]|nr:hypothetical protein [Gimesia aquarii]